MVESGDDGLDNWSTKITLLTRRGKKQRRAQTSSHAQNHTRKPRTFEGLAGDRKRGLLVDDVGSQRERLEGRAAAPRLSSVQQPRNRLRRLLVNHGAAVPVAAAVAAAVFGGSAAAALLVLLSGVFVGGRCSGGSSMRAGTTAAFVLTATLGT